VKGMPRLWTAAEADERLTSPTSRMLHEYDRHPEGQAGEALITWTFYRLEGERAVGRRWVWTNCWTPDALVLVEWGDKFKSIRKRATGGDCDCVDGRRCAQDYGDAGGITTLKCSSSQP